MNWSNPLCKYFHCFLSLCIFPDKKSLVIVNNNREIGQLEVTTTVTLVTRDKQFVVRFFHVFLQKQLAMKLDDWPSSFLFDTTLELLFQVFHWNKHFFDTQEVCESRNVSRYFRDDDVCGSWLERVTIGDATLRLKGRRKT